MIEEIPETDKMPEDLASDLEEILSISIGNKPKSMVNLLHDLGGGNRDKFIENIESEPEALKIENNYVYVLDLANEDDAKKYTEVMEQVGDPSHNANLVSMSPPSIMLDPTTPKGFRSIVVIKTCEIKRIKKKGKPSIDKRKPGKKYI